MRVLVTGARGFLGRNLVARLKRIEEYEPLSFDVQNDAAELPALLAVADVVVHLAGVNRPQDPAEFLAGNLGLTESIAGILEKTGRAIPIILASSIQATQANEYGKSKLAAEERLELYSQGSGAGVRIFRFANVFGKWCRPNYNSVVATFCHNIAHGLPIQINDPDWPIQLVYIDDVVAAILREIAGKSQGFGFAEAGPVHEITVGALASLIYGLEEARHTSILPDFANPLVKKLNSTYLSYLEMAQLPLAANLKSDERGWLFELIKSHTAGQIFVSTTKPGKKRGNHYHDTKVEKFCVISGQARISFRLVDSNQRHYIDVNGSNIQIIDIPPGYTHSIENTGEVDCVTLFWANEIFNPALPDTYFLEV